MPVLRQIHKINFTTLPNALLQDSKLSCRERGLLVWMLSKPTEWNFSHKALLAELPHDKKGAIQACVNKLTETGYLRISQERTNGKLGKAVWYVYDSPYPSIQDSEEIHSPHPKIPGSGKSTSYKRKNIEKAAPSIDAGRQPSGNCYYDHDAGEWRRKG